MTLIFAAVMAVVLAATGLFLYLRLESELNRSIDQDLQSRSQQLIKEMRVYNSGIGEAARSLLDKRAEEFAQVLTSSGRKFDPPQRTGRPVLPSGEVAQAGRTQLIFERPGRGGDPQPERYLARPFAFEGPTLIAVVGASLGDRNEALANLVRLLLIGGPIALLLASLAAYWTVGRALRPVDAMRRHAAEVSAAGSEQRLPVPRAHDELSRLGQTLNEMLDRLGKALEREREFVDDASHELRTPLATQRAELEIALKYATSTEELRGAMASAIDEADRLSRLAEDLLVIARSDKGQLPIRPEPIGVSELFEAARSRLAGRAERAGRTISVDAAPDAVVQADRVRVEQALGNLIENALRYGDGPVRLWSNQANGLVELHVGDEGPGFPPDFLPHAFERFRRADSARSGDGSGLGLSIVQAIAQAHGGRALVRNADLRGADVWIELHGATGERSS